MSSHLARRQDRRPELLDAADPWDLVVLDEAHHARRRGAGTAQESGPNALLRLVRDLRNRTDGLLLLTATPLQVHPVELWDLLSRLGLPPAWTEQTFARFLQEIGKEVVTNELLEWLSALFRASESTYRTMAPDDAERFTGLSRLKTKRVLDALREDSSIPRKQLNPEERPALDAGENPGLAAHATCFAAIFRPASFRRPLRIAKSRIASYDCRRMNPSFTNKSKLIFPKRTTPPLPPSATAVGFVMTIYRRRLASSFFALRKTLEKRRLGVDGLVTDINEAQLDEDAADLLEAAEELDTEAISEEERRALASEEIATIGTLIDGIRRLPVDIKAKTVVEILKELQATGYSQAMVFTQFTDTMDFLREHLAAQVAFQ